MFMPNAPNVRITNAHTALQRDGIVALKNRPDPARDHE